MEAPLQHLAARRPIHYDAVRRRLWICGQRCHHGATGAVLTYGDETVVIVTANGAPLMPADLSTPMVLNLPRSPVQLILDGTVTGGTPGADTLRGTPFADSLSGGDGGDFLSGGLSDDRLDGGTGGDTFFFGYQTETGNTALTRDVITDFRQIQLDQIDLHNIDADSIAASNQDFTFIGAAAYFGNAGVFWSTLISLVVGALLAFASELLGDVIEKALSGRRASQPLTATT